MQGSDMCVRYGRGNKERGSLRDREQLEVK